jgi:hypothetical protein
MANRVSAPSLLTAAPSATTGPDGVATLGCHFDSGAGGGAVIVAGIALGGGGVF